LSLDALIYIDNDLADSDLSFLDSFTPFDIASMLEKTGTIEKIFYSIPESYTGRLKGKPESFPRIGNDDPNFWKELFSKTGSAHFVKIYGDSPFLDGAIIADMAGLHQKYLAEFTYSENLPPGLSCEIVSKELIDSIPAVSDETISLSKAVKSNINQFDVELYYKDPDIRDKRIGFRSGVKRDRRIMENLYGIHKRIPGYAEIRDIIDNNPAVLYVSPSYLEIELTGECGLDCIFCYRKTLKKAHGRMEPGLFRKILGEMKNFDIPYSVCFGGSGEPLIHPNFYEMLGLAADEPLIADIIIETNGILAGDNYKNFLMTKGSGRIKTIVNINGLDSGTYTALHGTDHFDAVMRNILSLRELDGSGQNLFIQIMKINETEPFLDRYYDFWESHRVQIILQKQNTYMGRISDRRYTDLSPLERTPCWHLLRDLYVLSDGRAGFCKQDVDGIFSTGDLKADTVQDIRNRAQDNFIKDYRKKYHTNPDCRNCDEWYTFNF